MVQAIPLAYASVDLVTSRGSIPFWEELPKAFGALLRGLKSGGYAYIGGRLGDPLTRATFEEQMKREYPKWKNKKHKPPRRVNKHYTDALAAAKIDPSTVTRSDEGLCMDRVSEILAPIDQETILHAK